MRGVPYVFDDSIFASRSRSSFPPMQLQQIKLQHYLRVLTVLRLAALQRLKLIV